MTIHQNRSTYSKVVLGLCLLAGVLYNSWPLGFALDNATARHGLASDLELMGHPYNWLFILCDLLAAACVIAAVVIVRLRLWDMMSRHTRRWLLAGLLAFGVFTAASALLPYRCTVFHLTNCSAMVDGKIGLDAITSSLALLGLFISLCSLAASDKLHPRMRQPVLATLFLWSASAVLFVITALRYTAAAYFIQFPLIIMTGVALIVIGAHLNYPEHGG